MKLVTDKIKDYILEKYKYFHENPELAGKEENTQKYIVNELESMKITYQTIGTYVVADIKGNSDKKILLRADIDAEPVEEKTELPYKSKIPGVMHSKGHDASMAILLGAAKIFSEMKDLKGTVRFLFQSSKSDIKTTERLIEAGLLKNVESAFYIQMAPDLPIGTVSVESGERMAALDEFSITVTQENNLEAIGFGYPIKESFGHILSGINIVSNILNIANFEKSPLDPVSFLITSFNTEDNEAKINGKVNYFKKENKNHYSDLIENIIKATSKFYKTEATLDYKNITDPLINDDYCSVIAVNSSIEALGKESIVKKPMTMESNDFSNYLDEVPGLIAFLGTSNGSDETLFPLGSKYFGIDEKSLENGTKLVVQYILDYFGFAQ